MAPAAKTGKLNSIMGHKWWKDRMTFKSYPLTPYGRHAYVHKYTAYMSVYTHKNVKNNYVLTEHPQGIMIR